MSDIKKHRSDRYKEKSVEKDNKQISNEEEVEESGIKKVLLIIILILISLFGYVKYIATKVVVVNENKIESTLIPESFDGLKIIQISDIHYGTTIDKKELKQIVKKVNDYKPDIVFFTGNLIDKDINLNEDGIKEITDILKDLNPSLYKYAIYGQEDVDIDYFEKIMNDASFKLLNNQAILLYYQGNTPIEIVGFSPIQTNPDYSIINAPVEELDTSNLYKIILSNEPNSFDSIKNYDANLVLSGNTLGGLINIPLYGPLIIPENSTNYNKDFYKIDNIDFYISNGLGTNKINFRLFNHPSISLFRIYKS